MAVLSPCSGPARLVSLREKTPALFQKNRNFATTESVRRNLDRNLPGDEEIDRIPHKRLIVLMNPWSLPPNYAPELER